MFKRPQHFSFHKVLISLGNSIFTCGYQLKLSILIHDKFLKLLEIKSQMGSCAPPNLSSLATGKIKSTVYQP